MRTLNLQGFNDLLENAQQYYFIQLEFKPKLIPDSDISPNIPISPLDILCTMTKN